MFEDRDEKYTILKTLFGGYCLIVMGWTTFIAFKYAGAVVAVVSFFVPILAQAYWVYKYIMISGSLVTPFSVACILFFASAIGLGVVISDERQARSESQ
jgi:hypothetical protein